VSWGNALTSVAACGGMGAFIDFYIGKRGQQRVRGWLETWWLKLSYVRWGNFGREEALFAVQVMDRLFGRRLFSVRRMTSVTIITSVSICVMLSLFLLEQIPIYDLWDGFVKLHILFNVVFIVVSVGLSFSITRFAASRVANIMTEASYVNFLGFCFHKDSPEAERVTYQTSNLRSSPLVKRVSVGLRSPSLTMWPTHHQRSSRARRYGRSLTACHLPASVCRIG
jgi:hypothetical protein